MQEKAYMSYVICYLIMIMLLRWMSNKCIMVLTFAAGRIPEPYSS